MSAFCYEFPRPAVTVDLAAFAMVDNDLRVLMVRRGRPPFEGAWALPGGFLDLDEPAEAAARRELREEAGVELDPRAVLGPIGFYDAPDRDPRGRTISLSYAAATPPPPPPPTGGDDAAEAAWIAADPGAHPLAFDHAAILRDALDWLGRSVVAGPAGLAILPDEFDRDAVRTLFHALGLPLRSATTWLDRRVRAKSVVAGGTPGCYRRAEPTDSNEGSTAEADQ